MAVACFAAPVAECAGFFAERLGSEAHSLVRDVSLPQNNTIAVNYPGNRFPETELQNDTERVSDAQRREY